MPKQMDGLRCRVKLSEAATSATGDIYLYKVVGHNPVNLSFMVEQDIEVKNLKPASAKIYDYYETDEQAVAEYNHPCNTDGNSSNSS